MLQISPWVTASDELGKRSIGRRIMLRSRLHEVFAKTHSGPTFRTALHLINVFHLSGFGESLEIRSVTRVVTAISDGSYRRIYLRDLLEYKR